MIPTSHQLAPAPKRTEKRIHKEQHVDGIKAIHSRAADLMPADYLICHQESEPDRVHRIRALATQRRAIRNAKRLANANPQPRPESRIDPVLASRAEVRAGRRK